jgi:predicted RNase H-like HicB family nuclease
MKQFITDEDKLENKLNILDLNFPRLNPSHIDSVISKVDYYLLPDTTLTVCFITLNNGYIVTGKSAAVSLANFNEEVGKEVAYKNAREKIWELEGYLLKEMEYRKLLNVLKYPINILDSTDGYTIQFVDLPEGITYGHTLEEALKNAEDCFYTAITFYTEANKEIPTPSACTDSNYLEVSKTRLDHYKASFSKK